MKYKNLDLISLRKKCDLDFAHYTYKGTQCSCCYGPKDLAKRYWKNNIIQEDKDYDDIQYILFKNAYNGGGTVKKEDNIQDYVCVEWNLPDDKVFDVCLELQKQLGDEYMVVVPKQHYRCIEIYRKEYFKKEYINAKNNIEHPYFNAEWYDADKHTMVTLSSLSPEEKRNLVIEAKTSGYAYSWHKKMLYGKFNTVEYILNHR